MIFAFVCIFPPCGMIVISDLIARDPLDRSQRIDCLVHRLNPDPADSRGFVTTPRVIFRLRSSSDPWSRQD